MNFKCTESCMDSARVIGYRNGNIYPFTEKDLVHLANTGHFPKRFEPSDGEARAYMKEFMVSQESQQKAASKSPKNKQKAASKSKKNETDEPKKDDPENSEE